MMHTPTAHFFTPMAAAEDGETPRPTTNGKAHASFAEAWDAYVDTQEKLRQSTRKEATRPALARRLYDDDDDDDDHNDDDDAVAVGKIIVPPRRSQRYSILDSDIAPLLRRMLRKFRAKASARRATRLLVARTQMRGRALRRARDCLRSWRRRTVAATRSLQRYSYRNFLAPAATAFLVWSVRVQATNYLRSREIDTKRGKYLVSRVARLGVQARLRLRVFSAWRMALAAKPSARAALAREEVSEARREAAGTDSELARVQAQLKATLSELEATNHRAEEASARREAEIAGLRERMREEVARFESEVAAARESAHVEISRLETEAAAARAEAMEKHQENARLEAKLARAERNVENTGEEASRLALTARQEMTSQVVDLQETIEALEHRLAEAEEQASLSRSLQEQLDAHSSDRLRAEALADFLSSELEQKAAEAALLGSDVRDMRDEHARAVGASTGMAREASEAFREAENMRSKCAMLESDSRRMSEELEDCRTALRESEQVVGDLRRQLVETHHDVVAARSLEERAKAEHAVMQKLLRQSEQIDERRQAMELKHEHALDRAELDNRQLSHRVPQLEAQLADVRGRLAAAQAEAMKHADERSRAEMELKAVQSAAEAERDTMDSTIAEIRRDCDAKLDELANVAGEARNEARLLSERLETERLRPDALAAELSAAETENDMRSRESAGLRAMMESLEEELHVARMHITMLEAGEKLQKRGTPISAAALAAASSPGPSPGGVETAAVLSPGETATTALQRELARARTRLNHYESREMEMKLREEELLELRTKASTGETTTDHLRRELGDAERSLRLRTEELDEVKARLAEQSVPAASTAVDDSHQKATMKIADLEQRMPDLVSSRDALKTRHEESERKLELAAKRADHLTAEATRLEAVRADVSAERDALQAALDEARALESRKDARIAELERELEQRGVVTPPPMSTDAAEAEAEALRSTIDGMRASMGQKDARLAEQARELSRAHEQIDMLQSALDAASSGGGDVGGGTNVPEEVEEELSELRGAAEMQRFQNVALREETEELREMLKFKDHELVQALDELSRKEANFEALLTAAREEVSSLQEKLRQQQARETKMAVPPTPPPFASTSSSSSSSQQQHSIPPPSRRASTKRTPEVDEDRNIFTSAALARRRASTTSSPPTSSTSTPTSSGRGGGGGGPPPPPPPRSRRGSAWK
ncbi:hypothetical protein NFJ02_31g80360 [Pycnococcus provasolii]